MGATKDCAEALAGRLGAGTTGQTTSSQYSEHPLALTIPEMLLDEYVELARDIKANGLQNPIVMFEGLILDGRHRYRACNELGITPMFENFTGSAAEAKAFVVSLNVHRRHLTLDQKRAVVDAELRRDPHQSDRAIAGKARVSPTTVGSVRAELVERGQLSKLDSSIGRDGKTRKRDRKPQLIDAAVTAREVESGDGEAVVEHHPIRVLPIIVEDDEEVLHAERERLVGKAKRALDRGLTGVPRNHWVHVAEKLIEYLETFAYRAKHAKENYESGRPKGPQS